MKFSSIPGGGRVFREKGREGNIEERLVNVFCLLCVCVPVVLSSEMYVRDIQQGSTSVTAEPEVEKSTVSTALVNGNYCLGPVSIWLLGKRLLCWKILVQILNCTEDLKS